MRVAAIDVGTNSIHLLVAEIASDGHISILEKAREQVELGSGGLGASQITEEAFTRGVAAMAAFKDACDSFRVDDVTCAGTSAVREASNGSDFCHAVRAQTGLHIRAIAGRDEARLIYLGARADLDFSKGRAVVMDLGGGSTELILCDAEAALVTLSLPVGHIRLAESHPTWPTANEGLAHLRDEISQQLKPLALRVRTDDLAAVVGTSGAIRALARAAILCRGASPPEHDHGLVLRREDLAQFIDLFTRKRDPWSRLPSVDAKRRRTIPHAAVWVDAVLETLGKDCLVTSERSLLDGLVVDWILRHRPEIRLSATIHDPHRRSVLAVMERYDVDQEHARHVADLALQLYDGTIGIHKLRIDDRRILEFAALLHDVGHAISPRGHNKHGQYIIRHTRMGGFTSPEIAILGNLVRYHRGSRPKRTHVEYAALEAADRRRVKILSGMLQLADALDRGHTQVVSRLEITATLDKVCIRGQCGDAPHLERWASLRRLGLLSGGLNAEVEIVLSSEGSG